jgi:acetate kinase
MPEPCFHSRSTLKNRIGIKTRPQMLNESHNAETSGAISTDASRATVRVIRMDEELMIARSVFQLVGG